MRLGQIIGNCSKDRPRTGKGRCDKTEGLTTSLILTDPNALYPLDSAEFIEGMEGWVSDTGIMRMMPVHGLINDTPTGGEVSTSQVGYGPTSPVNLSAYSNLFQIDAGLCLYKELSKANRDTYRVFRVDSQGYIYGTVVTKNGVNYFAGFEAKVYCYPGKATDLTTEGGVFLGVYYGSDYELEMQNINAFEVGKIPEGLVGVLLQKGTTSGTAKVVGSCGGDDYTTLYGADWTQTMFVNSTGANPTSVVYNASTGLLTFTPVADYKVASASVLADGNILGLEGIDDLVSLT